MGTFGYDRNGNPTTYKGSTLAFDPENRMTAYGTALTNGYGPDGLRAWKQNSVGKTYFLYDGEVAVCEISASGTVTAANTYGGAGLLSRRSGGISEFYTFDLSGNVAQRLSNTASVLTSDLYHAFGQRQSTSGSDPFGFGGQRGYYTDVETGLILCIHRYYDPSAGRWLTRDPSGYEGGINLYSYTRNNPVVRLDPQGLDDSGYTSTGQPFGDSASGPDGCGECPCTDPLLGSPLGLAGTTVGGGLSFIVGGHVDFTACCCNGTMHTFVSGSVCAGSIGGGISASHTVLNGHTCSSLGGNCVNVSLPLDDSLLSGQMGGCSGGDNGYPSVSVGVGVGDGGEDGIGVEICHTIYIHQLD